MDVPPPIRDYLSEVTARLVRALADDLVGVWTAGSVALADYRQGRSDVDVLAMCAPGTIRSRRVHALELLRQEALPCPARGLELVVYPEPSPEHPLRGPAYLLELNDGAGVPFRAFLDPVDRFGSDARDEDTFWYAIDRSIVRDHGEALVGPPASSVLAAEPDADVLAAIRESVRWHARAPADRNAVLNTARGLAWSRDRRWRSKTDAGRWLGTVAGWKLLSAAVVGDDVDPATGAAFLDEAARELATAT